MKKNKLALTSLVLFGRSLAIVAAITIIMGASLSISAQDKIEYNQIYECAGSGAKFKVLSCAGTGKFDRCETFDINELSPGGGYKGSSLRGTLEDYYLGPGGLQDQGACCRQK